MKHWNYSPSEWDSYADEHILVIRALDSTAPSIFEFIRIKRDEDTGEAIWRHEVIFIEDYLTTAGEDALTGILHGHGYDSLDDFVIQTATGDEWVYGEDGRIDRNSPSYIIDLWLLASLIAESRGGGLLPDESEIRMPEKEALSKLKCATGLDYKSI